MGTCLSHTLLHVPVHPLPPSVTLAPSPHRGHDLSLSQTISLQFSPPPQCDLLTTFSCGACSASLLSTSGAPRMIWLSLITFVGWSEHRLLSFCRRPLTERETAIQWILISAYTGVTHISIFQHSRNFPCAPSSSVTCPFKRQKLIQSRFSSRISHKRNHSVVFCVCVWLCQCSVWDSSMPLPVSMVYFFLSLNSIALCEFKQFVHFTVNRHLFPVWANMNKVANFLLEIGFHLSYVST